MATGTAQTSARSYGTHQVHYLGPKTFNYSDAGISTGIKLGTLPAGAEILRATVKVKTAFNAATTNVLTVGQNASTYNDIVNAADVDEAVTEGTVSFRGMDLTFTADKDVYVVYTQTGTAATAGQCKVYVEYAIADGV